MAREYRRQLRRAGFVGARGYSNEKMLVHLAYIAAIDGARGFDSLQPRPEPTHRFGHRFDFAHASFRAGSRCNRHPFRDDKGILDEGTVRIAVVRAHYRHCDSTCLQRAAVGGVLLERLAKIRAGRRTIAWVNRNWLPLSRAAY